MTEPRAERVRRVVAEVVGTAVRDAGAAGVVLLADDSPEAGLAADWIAAAIGSDRLWLVRPPPVDAARRLVGSLVADSSAASASARLDEAAVEEAQRFAGRAAAAARDALLAHPANKTALLLSPRLPPEPLLPLGDLYASQIDALAGAWSAPAPVRDLAQRAGGIHALDAALAAMVDRRIDPAVALATLPAAVAEPLAERYAAGRFARRRPGLVPKVGGRTLGIDLFA